MGKRKKLASVYANSQAAISPGIPGALRRQPLLQHLEHPAIDTMAADRPYGNVGHTSFHRGNRSLSSLDCNGNIQVEARKGKQRLRDGNHYGGSHL